MQFIPQKPRLVLFRGQAYLVVSHIGFDGHKAGYQYGPLTFGDAVLAASHFNLTVYRNMAELAKKMAVN